MLRISKGGKLLYKKDNGKRWYDVTKDMSGFLTKNPHNQCEIDDGVTFFDIFKMFKKNEEILYKVLHPNLKDFFREINKKDTGDCGDCSHIEIYWSPTLDEDGLIDSIHMHLVKDIKGNDEDFPYYSLTLTPLNEMKNLPVKLNEKYNVMSFGKKDGKKALNTVKSFTLIDIISCIMWEISWFGTPENREIKCKELFGQD